MTDRINSLLVTFEKDIREDDVQCIIDAILMIRGVLNVTTNVTDSTLHIAEMRAKQEYRDKLWKVLYE